MTDLIDALQGALAAEHSAVYGYGIVGAHLDGRPQADARAAEAVHRGRRDALILDIIASRGIPVAAAAAYDLPFRVVDASTAFRLAVTLEEATERAWRAAVGGTTDAHRRNAVSALADGAVRAAKWRVLAFPTRPATVAFPGT